VSARDRRSRQERDGFGASYDPAGLRNNLKLALIILIMALTWGTVGYMVLEGWGALDSFYMTILTLSTVGYGEVHPLSPSGRLFSVALIVMGVGTVAYAVRTGAQIMLDERIRTVLGRRTMKTIQKIKNHYIICGYGRMGRVICQELRDRGFPFVVVDNNVEAISELERQGYLFIRGDATLDEVLLEAGIERAKGIVSVVTHDTENVFITLTARGLNPRLNIVVRAGHEESVQKLVRAGANKVISPHDLGGFRIAQALLRPTVLDFLERIIDDRTLDLVLEEVEIVPGSRLDGVMVADSGLRKELNLIILAIKDAKGGMTFNPSHKIEIKAGDTLVVLGRGPDLEGLNRIV
jgi:voltage-gated potassium channel